MKRGKAKKDPNKYPKGWDRRRVEEVISYYDNQTQDEAIAEAEAAWENSRMTLVRVPAELVDEVKEFIAKARTGPHRKKARRSA